MKNLNFQSYNVSVLDHESLKKQNGGIWAPLWFVVSTLAVCAIDNPDEFWEGYDSVRK